MMIKSIKPYWKDAAECPNIIIIKQRIYGWYIYIDNDRRSN